VEVAQSMRLVRVQLFLPIIRAIGQLDDPVFRGVVFRSLAWAMACFIGLCGGGAWGVHQLLAFHGWLAWTADVLGSIGVALLAFWLFLPIAAGIGMLFCNRIASAVERRFYPWLPRAESASILEQVWDSISLAINVLALSIAALIFAFIVPGLGLVLGWVIASYAIGRGLFVAVAMRRMSRSVAESVYLQNRGIVLAQGGVLALAAYIPLLNLLIPVVGTAAMVHILDMALAIEYGSDRFETD
jgi:CysZ protein